MRPIDSNSKPICSIQIETQVRLHTMNLILKKTLNFHLCNKDHFLQNFQNFKHANLLIYLIN